MILVGSRPEHGDGKTLEIWDDLRDILRVSYGEQRNLDYFVQKQIVLKAKNIFIIFLF